VYSIDALHRFLKVREVLGMSFQAFVDLLQRVGEEQKLMDLHDVEMDDYVPLTCVKAFLDGAYTGAAQLLADVS